MRARPIRIGWKAPLAWVALVVGLLVGADLLERFVIYGTAKKDAGSLVRFARRPVKDTALTLLHSLPGDLEGFASSGEVPVFDFYLKPEDETYLRALISRVQVLSTHDEVTKEEVSARMSVDGQDYDVRVKLRGRQYYHVVPPRPSLRVDLRHGRSYRSSTLFNLIDPFDKTGDQVFLWESQV